MSGPAVVISFALSESISICLTVQVFILSKLLILIFGYHHMMTTNIRYNRIYFFLKYLYILRIVTIKLHLIMELIPPLKGLNMPMSVSDQSLT